jgi:hypothetical protein
VLEPVCQAHPAGLAGLLGLRLLSLPQHRQALRVPAGRQDLERLLVPADHAGLSGHAEASPGPPRVHTYFRDDA